MQSSEAQTPAPGPSTSSVVKGFKPHQILSNEVARQKLRRSRKDSEGQWPAETLGKPQGPPPPTGGSGTPPVQGRADTRRSLQPTRRQMQELEAEWGLKGAHSPGWRLPVPSRWKSFHFPQNMDNDHGDLGDRHLRSLGGSAGAAHFKGKVPWDTQACAPPSRATERPVLGHMASDGGQLTMEAWRLPATLAFAMVH